MVMVDMQVNARVAKGPAAAITGNFKLIHFNRFKHHALSIRKNKGWTSFLTHRYWG